MYYFPVKKLNIHNLYFEKEFKNNFGIIHDSVGYDQDGFNRKGFDRIGFDGKGNDKYGYNRNKELASHEHLKQALIENTNTYQHAFLPLKHNVDLAIFFLEQGGSFSLISKHLRKNEMVVGVAVEKNPNSFQHVGKKLGDDDDIFKLAFQQNLALLGYAIERLRRTYRTRSC